MIIIVSIIIKEKQSLKSVCAAYTFDSSGRAKNEGGSHQSSIPSL